MKKAVSPQGIQDMWTVRCLRALWGQEAAQCPHWGLQCMHWVGHRNHPSSATLPQAMCDRSLEVGALAIQSYATLIDPTYQFPVPLCSR